MSVRVRFAPSPTGPLHIGGVRTALYNYLLAKQQGGVFILRIEDTDQTRLVPGAEEYIKESLEWLGLIPNEGPGYGGDFGPYKQSERKSLYAKYALELVEKGHAYYAFDTPDELTAMRKDQEAKGHHSAKYDARIRMEMRNSLTLSEEESNKLIAAGEGIIRLKMPSNEEVSFEDSVREKVTFNTNELDDKVILKRDGMPTYHLANIVDDHLMEITHVIRGEEWLSSTAHHVLMYRFFGWTPPQFCHLPLILKPTGKGKLSKRDGAKFGFPVFPLQWHDKKEDAIYAGFRESGYNQNALLNFLVLLGWSPGNDEEILSVDRMIELFSLGKIVKSGARFDVDKSLWFNQQYLKSQTAEELLVPVKAAMPENISSPSDDYLKSVIGLMKDRMQVHADVFTGGAFFFNAPESYDEKQVKKRYQPDQDSHFSTIKTMILEEGNTAEGLADEVKGFLNDNSLKMGAYLPLLRIMICGALKGPDLFEIIHTLGADESAKRMDAALPQFASILAST